MVCMGDRLRTGFAGLRLPCSVRITSNNLIVPVVRRLSFRFLAPATQCVFDRNRRTSCVVSLAFPSAHGNFEFVSLLLHKNILRDESSNMDFQSSSTSAITTSPFQISLRVHRISNENVREPFIAKLVETCLIFRGDTQLSTSLA